MSRVAHPSEKVLAIASIYGRLIEELGLVPPELAMPTAEVVPGFHLTPSTTPTIEFAIPPVVMAALIDAATRVAMATDTRDMGIMAGTVPASPPCPARYRINAVADLSCSLLMGHEGEHLFPPPEDVD